MKFLLPILAFALSINYGSAQSNCNYIGVDASFTYTVDTNNTVVFTNTTHPIDSFTYEWNVYSYNAPIDTNRNPIYTYPAADVYYPELRVTDRSNVTCWIGDTISVNYCFTILNNITYREAADNPPNVKTLEIAYYGSVADSVFWDFGDGKTSNDYYLFGRGRNYRTNHTYDSIGTYQVIASVIDPFNNICSDTITVEVECIVDYSYNFDTTNTIYFTNKSKPKDSLSFSWTLDQISGQGTIYDSTRNPTYTYSSSRRVNYIALEATLPNNNKYVKEDTVSINYCDLEWKLSNNEVSIWIGNYKTRLDTINWNFGDGQSSNQYNYKSYNWSKYYQEFSTTHAYFTDSTYKFDVRVVDEFQNVCYDTIQIVNEDCYTNFEKYLDTVRNTVILKNYTSDKPGATYTYSFGDSSGVVTSQSLNISHQYAQFGTYLVCVTVSDTTNGQQCYSTFCDSVGLDSLGSLKAGGISIEFRDTNYVIGQLNCNDIGVDASFTFTVDTNNTVIFTNTTQPIDSFSYEWDVNPFNAPIDTNRNPVYTYPAADVYYPELRVTDLSNVTCWIRDTIFVNFCSIGLNNVTLGQAANNSPNVKTFEVDYYGSIADSVFWDFGDGKTSDDYFNYGVGRKYRTDHTYDSIGIYQVIAAVVDPFNNICSDTITVSVSIVDYDYSFDSNNTIYFTNKSKSIDSLSFRWTLDQISGQGTIYDSTRNPVYTYASSRQINYIALEATFPDNKKFVKEDTLSINYCDLEWRTSNNEVSVWISNYKTKLDTINWDFGDGKSSNQFQVDSFSWSSYYQKFKISHNYLIDSSYAASVKVIDEFNNVCHDTIQIVYEDCYANFGKFIDTINNTVILTNYTTDKPGATYTYSFGDSSSAVNNSSLNISHRYSQYGTYLVCITISDTTNGQQCYSTFCDSVGLDSLGNLMAGGFSIEFIDPNYGIGQSNCNDIGVDASFTYTVDTNNTVIFTNTTQPIDSFTYEWRVNPLSAPVDTNRNPVYTYPAADVYYPELRVTDRLNVTCWIADTISVNFCSIGLNSITYGQAANNSPNVKTFEVDYYGSIADSVFWDFGDGKTSDNYYNYGVGRKYRTDHTYDSIGIYQVIATVVDPFNNICSDTITVSVSIVDYDYSFDSNNTIYFTNKSKSIDSLSFRWTLDQISGQGTIYDSTRNPVYTYASSRQINYIALEATFPDNKKFVKEDTLSINYCDLEWRTSNNEVSVWISNYKTKLDTINWDFGDGQSSNQYNYENYNWSKYYQEFSTVHTYLIDSAYSFDVRVVDEFQNVCYDTLQIVYEDCIASFSKQLDTAANTVILTNYTSNKPGATYTYSFGDSSNAVTTSSLNISHRYSQYGTYLVCITISDTTNGQQCYSTFCDSVGLDSLGNLKAGGFSIEFRDTNNVTVAIESVAESNLNKILVYPNPSHSLFNIELNKEYTNLDCKLYNSIGMQVLSHRLDSDLLNQINLKDFPSGIYYLIMTERNDRRVVKLIKY